MLVGSEHEFSINDANLNALSINDWIMKKASGEYLNDFLFGDISLSKELQKHVIEIIPNAPQESIVKMENLLVSGLNQLYTILEPGTQLMGLGMHPTIKPTEAKYWDHEDIEIYALYDKLFNIYQHGWLNIQAFQLNLSYTKKDMARNFNYIRSLLPYFAAIGANSVIVEGKTNNVIDNRLNYYRVNQNRIPLITNDIIPEVIKDYTQYQGILEDIYKELRKIGGDELCYEWINSRGLLIRDHRKCLELKVIDEQECIKMDMAFTAFIRTLVAAPHLPLETDRSGLLSLLQSAINQGTSQLKPELQKLIQHAYKYAITEDKPYLKLIERRINEGCLGEVILNELKHVPQKELLQKLADSLKYNEPYFGNHRN
jgi:hypothetical protein